VRGQQLRKVVIFVALVAFQVAVSSCSFFPQRDESPEPELPAEFSLPGRGDSLPGDWWESFGDPELSRLVAESFSANLDLRQIEARLRRARAAATLAGADLYPRVNLDLEGGATRSRTDTGATRVTTTAERYTAALAASYELDLWGRVSSIARSAEADTTAAAWDVDAARVSLAAEIADLWLSAVELKERRSLVEGQLETNLTYLELVRLRQLKGLSSALAVFQQEQIVAATETLLPQLQADLETTLHSLAVLVGRPPLTDLGLSLEALPDLAPRPALGLPSELLERRPDIQAAQARLEAADWQVSAARANRLPSLSLTGSAGYDSADFSRLFDNWFAGFVAGLVTPLIDGGSRSAEVARTEAISDENLAAYRETILTALKEVEDALVREDRQNEYIGSLDKQLQAARNAFAEAMLRYRKGDIEYLDVLASLGSVQELERKSLAARRDVLLYRVSLYRALGGGWESDPDKGERDQDEE